MDIGARNQYPLGPIIARGHIIWEWSLDCTKGELYHVRGDEVAIYQQTHDENRKMCRAGRWHINRTRRWGGGFAQKLCTVSLDDNTSLATIVLQIECPTEEPLPSSILEVLKKWKQTWMWENLKWTGEDGWIAGSIHDGSSIAVTDGSYMKICSRQYTPLH